MPRAEPSLRWHALTIYSSHCVSCYAFSNCWSGLQHTAAFVTFRHNGCVHSHSTVGDGLQHTADSMTIKQTVEGVIHLDGVFVFTECL